MTDSFFESIRKFFDKKYDGRYFSLVLCELALHEPKSLRANCSQCGSEGASESCLARSGQKRSSSRCYCRIVNTISMEQSALDEPISHFSMTNVPNSPWR